MRYQEGDRVVGIFGRKLNPLQALEAAEAKKAAKANKRPSLALIALVTLGVLAFLVLGKSQNPSQEETETQAALTTEHPSAVDSQSSAQPVESSAQVTDAFAQLGEASAKSAEIATELPPKLAKVDRSPEQQKNRRALLETLTSQGIFIRAEVSEKLPRLWVGPAFHSLEFDRKETYISVVHAYYLDGSDEYSVRIFDGRTNKEIGNFALAAGLKLY